MKKFLALAACLSLLAAGTALAAKPKAGKFAGELQLGYDMSFKVKKGKIVKVVANGLEYCSDSSGSSVTTIAPDGGWKIKRGGKFSGSKKETFDGGSFVFTLEGRFTEAGKAKGTIRQQSVVVGSVCDTHKLKFSVTRK